MTGNWEIPDFTGVELAKPSAPGPHDARYLFGAFKELMDRTTSARAGAR